MSNITKDQVIEWLSSQTVLDLAALVKDLEGKWGVSAAAAVASQYPLFTVSFTVSSFSAAPDPRPSLGVCLWPRPCPRLGGCRMRPLPGRRLQIEPW